MTRIALVQQSARADWPSNRAFLEEALSRAADGGARIALMPENLALMGRCESDKLALAEVAGTGPVQDFLRESARRLKLWLVAGTIPERSADPGHIFAACPVYDDTGEEVARYRKIHLFDVSLRSGSETYRESATVAPGREVVAVDTPAGRLGLSVCYDIRFPELYRQLSVAGAEWLAIPSAFTVVTGQAHWDVLTRARAIENLCYVAAPAQTGLHDNGRATYGHSRVVAPWGEVVAELAEGEGIVFAEIDREEIARRRASIPCLDHRRFGCHRLD